MDQPTGAAVLSQRDTQETGAGYPAEQAEYQRTEGRRAGAQGYGEPTGARHGAPRRYYGMAGTLMVLSGMLTFFVGITGVIRGIFFNTVATYPFYYSVRSRGWTLVAIGAVAFLVGLALLIYMSWARHAATVVAIVSAVANFMFLPFYPLWSIVILSLDIVVIWELTRQRREFARLPRPAWDLSRNLGIRELWPVTRKAAAPAGAGGPRRNLDGMNLDDLAVAEFAFPGPLRDRLVAAILSGAKTSTSSLMTEYERGDEPLPEAGQLSAVVDSAGRRVAAIEVTEVRVVRLAEVDLRHAVDEGEGYESVAQWRSGHEKFWHSPEVRAELGDPDFTVDDDTLVVAERFRLVDVAAEPGRGHDVDGGNDDERRP